MVDGTANSLHTLGEDPTSAIRSTYFDAPFSGYLYSTDSISAHPHNFIHQTSTFSHLFILVLPPISFRQFQKFSKLLNPLRLQNTSIQLLSIMLQPRIIFASLLRIIFGGVTLVGLNKRHHLIISCNPLLVLCHFF